MKCDELQDQWFNAYPVEGDQLIEIEVYSKKYVDEAIEELRKENKELKEALERQKNAYLKLDDMYQRDTGIVCKAMNPGVPCAEMKKVMAENEDLKNELFAVKTDLAMATRWRNFKDEPPERHQWIEACYYKDMEKPRIKIRRWDEGMKYDVFEQELYIGWRQLPKAPEVK